MQSRLYVLRLTHVLLVHELQIRDNDILTVGDIREVEQALKRWGEYDAFHPPILGHTA
jgi:hypothetical protein